MRSRMESHLVTSVNLGEPDPLIKHVIRSLDNESESVGIPLEEQQPVVDENLTAVINYKINEFKTRQKSICEA